MLACSLWFAFKIVSLTYQTHLFRRGEPPEPVVICFQNCIFDIPDTPVVTSSETSRCCDLLSKLYLWHTRHTPVVALTSNCSVVICFQNCIFDIPDTPNGFSGVVPTELWFAFKIVSLTYQTHLNMPKTVKINNLQTVAELKNEVVADNKTRRWRGFCCCVELISVRTIPIVGVCRAQQPAFDRKKSPSARIACR